MGEKMKNKRDLSIKKALNIYGFKYILLILTGILQALFSVLIAISIKNLINYAENLLSFNKILAGIITLLSLVLLSFLMGVINKLLLSNLATNADVNLKKFVFSKFFDGEYKSIDNYSSGDIISRLDGDVLKISSVSVALTPSFLANVFHVLSIIVVMLILAPIFTLILLCAGLLTFLITYFLRKISYKLYKNTRNAIAKINSHIIESKKNALYIKSDGGEEYVKNENCKYLNVFKNSVLKQRYFNNTLVESTSFAFAVFNILTVLYCVLGIFNGNTFISFGLLVAMLQLVMQIKTPLLNLSSYITVYEEMLVSEERIKEIINIDKSSKLNVSDKEFESLELKNVSFSYGNYPVLKDVSLKINKGDKVLIKGLSGAGKSTLLKIILGVYSANEGSVICRLNGSEYYNEKIKGLYSLVPQGNMLFSGTILENLTFNSENLNIEEINDVLNLVCLKDFVQSCKDKLNTVISENSTTVSEGQGQRLAIARAILKKAPVIILDEGTSSLDEETEKTIIKNLSKIKDLTLIAVSHKDAISSLCNKTYKIENGSLIKG